MFIDSTTQYYVSKAERNPHWFIVVGLVSINNYKKWNFIKIKSKFSMNSNFMNIFNMFFINTFVK